MSGIYPHNSDKCHCPECEKVRGQVRDIAKTEIKHADFDKAVRMISPVGRISFPSLMSDAEREMRRIAGTKDYDEWVQERREALRERQAWRDRAYYSKQEGCHWQWKFFSGTGWMRVNIHNGKPFGEVFRGVEFTPTGYKARYHRRPWRDQAPITMHLDEMTSRNVGRAIGATEHIVTHKVGELEKTVTDRVEFAERSIMATLPKWADGGFIGGGAKPGADVENDPINLKQERPVLSPLKLSLLLWRDCHDSRPYPMNSSSIHMALRDLERLGLVKVDQGDVRGYVLTPRAAAFVQAVKALPLPVKSEPTWEMPS